VSRPLRLAGYIGLGIVAGLLVATTVIFLFTRTEWGMERGRRFVVRWLEERVDGELRLGRITGPGLLSGVRIHDFGIIDARGRPFLSTDSLELSYDWRSLLAGRILLNRVVLYRPHIYIERLPGDTIWNFEHIFGGGSPEAPADRSLIVFDDARIVDGQAVLRMPFEPDGPGAPADTSRLILEEAPGGLLRTMRFENLNARLSRVIWESPIEPGRLFDIQTVQGRGFVWREPFIIRDARGTLTVRDSIVAFDLPDVRLPASQASLLGRVTVRTGGNEFDVRVDGRQLQLRDLRWLYPNLPEEGSGSLVLRIQTQPDGILWLAENARLQTPGSQIAGSVGVVTGDSLYFTRVDLRAAPLDVTLLEQLLPGGLPVDGLLVGTVEVSGPLSALQTSGELRYANGAGAAAGADLSWRGVLDVRDRTRITARSLHADVRSLELALLSAFNPGLRLSGTVAGSVDGSGALDRMSFTAALQHASPDGAHSSFDGGGSIVGQGSGRHFDITMNATPATLQDLLAQFPALGGLAGELRGPLHVAGTAEAMAFAAQLSTPGGELRLSGRLDGSGATRRVRAEAHSPGFGLHALRPGLPHSMVAGRLTLDVTGTRLDDASGTVEVLLDSAQVGSVPFGRFAAGAHLADGLLVVDSASLLTSAGVARAAGALGLVETRQGRLRAGFLSESLTPFEEHVFGAGATAGAEPRLAGRIDALATATGWLGDVDVEARIRAEDLVYGGVRARRGSVELTAPITRMAGQTTRGTRFDLVAAADSLTVLGHALQAARLEVSGAPDAMALTLLASAEGRQKLHALAGVTRRHDAPSVIRLEELRVGGASPWTLRAPASIAVRAGVARVDTIVLERADGGRATVGGRLARAALDDPGSAPLDLHVDLMGVPFTDVLAALRSREEGAGVVDGTLHIRGTALAPLMEAEITARDLVYGDVRIDRALAELSYASLGIDMHAEAQHGGRGILTGGGRIPLDLRFAPVGERRPAQPLRVSITADSLPPALPLALLDGFTNVGGRIDGTLSLGGTTLDPSLSGGFTLRNVSADWEASGVRYSNVTGSLQLERGRMLHVDVHAQAADPRVRGVRSLTASGGSGTVRGSLDFSTLSDPLFDLRFTAERAYAARRRDVEATVTGEVRLAGRYREPEVSGWLRVDQGALYIDELYRRYLIVGLEFDDPTLLSMVDTSLVAVRPFVAASANPFLRNLQIRNMRVAVANEAWLRSRDMDVEVSGDLNVTFDRLHEDLRMTGSLDVERGTYTLYYPPLQSRRFQVREGSIEFPGTPGIDPSLAITAVYRARANGDPLDVLAVVTGTLQNPRVRLASDAQPPYSESDLASYLFFGVPSWEVAGSGGPGTADVRAVAGIGLSALRPSVLGYASSGLQTLVQSAGLLDYVGLTAAEVAPGDNALLAGTQLELGRYFWRSSLFVGYSQRLGNLSSDPAVRVEWRFQPEFSLELFAEDRFARAPGFGFRSESGLRKVYGFSLFREWGF
jgi:autotransporter translocation and assembly factor TamB